MPRPRPRRRRPPDGSLPDITPLEPVAVDEPPAPTAGLGTVRLVPRPDQAGVGHGPAGTLATGDPAPHADPRQLEIDEARMTKQLAERVYRRARQDLERATAATQRAHRHAVSAAERVEKLRQQLMTAEERAHEADKAVAELATEAKEIGDKLKHVYETLDAARRRVRELESPHPTA
jgi:hypothetical protein